MVKVRQLTGEYASNNMRKTNVNNCKRHVYIRGVNLHEMCLLAWHTYLSRLLCKPRRHFFLAS